MTRTQLASENYGDGLTKRPDLNVDEAGSAVIRKVIAGSRIAIASTGVDAGTGDVTVRNSLFPGAIYGFKLAWASNATVTIAAGACRSSDDTLNIITTSNLTPNLGNSGANGLDTGSEAANSFYAVFVIADSTGVNSPAALFSLSATSPTLPSGYDKFRRIGWVGNNASSNISLFTQRGSGPDRWYNWALNRNPTLALSGGSATSFTAVSLNSVVPPGIRHVQLKLLFNPASSGNVASLRPTGSVSTSPNFGMVAGFVPASPGISAFEMMPTANGSRSIDYQVGNASDTLDIAVQGYMDEI